MRIFEERYFNINKRFLICTGLWPYETQRRKCILRAIVISVLTVGNLAQLTGMVVYYEDRDKLMLCILCFFVLSVMQLKVLAMILAEKKMKSLHKNIANIWEQIQDSCERDILHSYSEKARNAVIYYVAVVVTSALTITLLPIIPKILNFMRPLENPRPSIYISASEIFIDRETHFLPYFILEYIEIMTIALVAITVDTMYIVSVEQCCALYAIVRFRVLELRSIPQKKSSGTEDVDSYEWLYRTIQIHQDALIFSSLLNKSYSKLFLFLMILALFIIPFDSCAIIANLDNSLHLIPYVIFLVDIVIQGFVIAYPGQRLIDHQQSLLDAAYCSDWYTTPLRTRKLLLIFMMRCTDPIMITAGDLVPINFPVYFKVMKTSASYITVASSFR